MEGQQPARRLCSEIQLFDLCELEVCPHKDGRFCTEPGLLARFEAIKEEDERSPQQYLAEELDEEDGEVDDEESYDDDYEEEDI
jgi:hypothetical protein